MPSIFTKILSGEIPCAKVYEDDYVLAFLDIGPVHPGHTLVIPEKEVITIFDADEETLKALIIAIKKVAKAVKEATHCDGLNVLQNNFRASGQLVDHLHFHLIPRFANDGLKHWPQGKYEEGQMEELQKRIKGAL